MSDSKLPKPNKKDLSWQRKVNKNLEKEKITLNNPKGLERFETVVRRAKKSK